MHRIKIFADLIFILFAASLPGVAQMTPAQPDPLARIREAAQGNTQACSATGETLCEQVAPKIIANAMGDSPLAENLRHLTDFTDQIGGRPDGTTVAGVVAWGVAAFHDAGIDAHTEKYTSPHGGLAELENVVAEIRGREKPDEWVLVGAHLDSWAHPPGVRNDNCDAAMVIEAARDILRTGIRPRRSIRFVLFTGEEHEMPGSWAYAHAHRADLDHARAAIFFHEGCSRVNGFMLNGRQDLESGLREAMKPVESRGADHYDLAAVPGADDFDFVVEGVPTLTAFQMPASDSLDAPAVVVTPVLADLKRNTAVVSVTAFGIAERAQPIGPRQSRAEIESLLKESGLEREMKTTGLWPLWESGERGRLP